MIPETAEGRCPECGRRRYKTHVFANDIAVCVKCGHREIIEYTETYGGIKR